MTTIAESAPRATGAVTGDSERPYSLGLLAVAGALWIGLGTMVLAWPDAQELERTSALGGIALALGAIQLLASAAGRRSAPLPRPGRAAPWLVVLALAIVAWEIATAKLDLLPLPFFPSPQAFVEVDTDHWRRVGSSLLAPVLLLPRRSATGALAGLLCAAPPGWA